jgi:hypothetical protein
MDVQLLANRLCREMKCEGVRYWNEKLEVDEDRIEKRGCVGPIYIHFVLTFSEREMFLPALQIFPKLDFYPIRITMLLRYRR